MSSLKEITKQIKILKSLKSSNVIIDNSINDWDWYYTYDKEINSCTNCTEQQKKAYIKEVEVIYIKNKIKI